MFFPPLAMLSFRCILCVKKNIEKKYVDAGFDNFDIVYATKCLFFEFLDYLIFGLEARFLF